MFIARLFFRSAAIQRVSAALRFGGTRKAINSVLLELVMGTLLTQDERAALLLGITVVALRNQSLLSDTAKGQCLFDELPCHTTLLQWCVNGVR